MTNMKEYVMENHGAFLKDVFLDNDVDLVRIIKIHLYCEYWINKLILAKVKTGKKIIHDHNNYSFAIKVDLIYNLGFIIDEVYINLRKLNNLRNGFAHNLHYKLKPKDMDYPHMNYLEDVDFTQMDSILMVALVTYSRLHKVCTEEFGLSTDPGEL